MLLLKHEDVKPFSFKNFYYLLRWLVLTLTLQSNISDMSGLINVWHLVDTTQISEINAQC